MLASGETARKTATTRDGNGPEWIEPEFVTAATEKEPHHMTTPPPPHHHPTTAQLEQLLSLTKRKAALQAELEAIQRQIAAAFTGEKERPVVVEIEETTPKAPRKTRKPRAKKPGKAPESSPASGESTKDRVIAVLQSAGKDGMSVADVAEKLGVKKNTLNVWFYTTGKKVKEIKKVGRGRFAAR